MHCAPGTDVSVASQHTFQGSGSQALEGGCGVTHFSQMVLGLMCYNSCVIDWQSSAMRDFPLMKGGSHCSRVTKLQFPGISSENAWRKEAMAVGGRMGGKVHSRSFSNQACHLNSNDSSASFFL